jgi:hypothetical protein
MKQRETDSRKPRPMPSTITLVTMRIFVTQFLDRHGITHREWYMVNAVCVSVPDTETRFLIALTAPFWDRGGLVDPDRPWVFYPAKIRVDGFGEQHIHFHVNEMEGFLTMVLQHFHLFPTQLVLPTPPNPVPMTYRWFGAWDTSVFGRSRLK